MSLSALVAAMRPNAYGSSTIGVKKSAVWTSASSSVRRTTPASSAVAVATSTRGSLGWGRPATIGRRSAADSLQPQPAPCEREDRAGSISRLSCPAVPEYTGAQLDAAVEALSGAEKREEAPGAVAGNPAARQ